MINEEVLKYENKHSYGIKVITTEMRELDEFLRNKDIIDYDLLEKLSLAPIRQIDENDNIPLHFYVYALSDPIGNIFYIGKGKKRRVFEHERLASTNSDFNLEKQSKIQEISKNGGKVIKTIIAEFIEETHAYKLEQYLIFLSYVTGRNITNSDITVPNKIDDEVISILSTFIPKINDYPIINGKFLRKQSDILKKYQNKIIIDESDYTVYLDTSNKKDLTPKALTLIAQNILSENVYFKIEGDTTYIKTIVAKTNLEFEPRIIPMKTYDFKMICEDESAIFFGWYKYTFQHRILETKIYEMVLNKSTELGASVKIHNKVVV